MSASELRISGLLYFFRKHENGIFASILGLLMQNDCVLNVLGHDGFGGKFELFEFGSFGLIISSSNISLVRLYFIEGSPPLSSAFGSSDFVKLYGVLVEVLHLRQFSL